MRCCMDSRKPPHRAGADRRKGVALGWPFFSTTLFQGYIGISGDACTNGCSLVVGGDDHPQSKFRHSLLGWPCAGATQGAYSGFASMTTHDPSKRLPQEQTP